MSRYCCYELRGWDKTGMCLSAEVKDEILDMLNEIGTEDYGSEVPDGDPLINCFTTERQSAAGEVHHALIAFATNHPGLLLELEFICQEENTHCRIRYLNDQQEFVKVASLFPPFSQLTLPHERHSGYGHIVIVLHAGTVQAVYALSDKPEDVTIVDLDESKLDGYDADDRESTLAWIHEWLDKLQPLTPLYGSLC